MSDQPQGSIKTMNGKRVSGRSIPLPQPIRVRELLLIVTTIAALCMFAWLALQKPDAALQQSDDSYAEVSQTWGGRMADIERKIAELQDRLDEHTSSGNYTKLKMEVWQLQSDLHRLTSKPATVSPDSSAFSLCRNEYGAFPVAIDGVQPYLDGYKIKMKIGNPTSATLTDVDLRVVCSPRSMFNGGADEFSDGLKRMREVNVNPAKIFPSASWTAVDVIVGNVAPADIGVIDVWLDIKGVSLSGSR